MTAKGNLALMQSEAVSGIRIRFSILLAVLVGVLAAGCAAPPIGAKRSSTKAVYAQMEGNALNSDQPSADTRTILHRFDLLPLPKNHSENLNKPSVAKDLQAVVAISSNELLTFRAERSE